MRPFNTFNANTFNSFIALLPRLLCRLPLALACWAFLTAGAQTDHALHAGSGELPAGAFTTRSLYQVESTWVTESGQRLRLGDLRGKVRVLALVYTSCDYACPLLVETMKRLEVSLAPELRSRVGFVVVTFDPERDTPEVLKAYSEKRQLDLQSWTLLSGRPDDILELAILLGVKYKKDPRGGFAHSNILTVLNKEGEIVHRHTGLRASLADTLAAIHQAAQD
jgi:protein SCO1/2